MALCWPSLLLLIYAVSINADSTYTLTPEVTNFIPTCAQTCFISFLDSNFDTSTCGTTPTLDCLCSHNTTTGYTVGEGGVQCIISEDNIGFCKGNDAQKSVVNDAFNMCAGQANALPNTHATITATLIVESSMPSVVLIASNPTTTQTFSWSSRVSSTPTTPSITSTSTTTQSTPAASTYSAMASSMSPTASATTPLTRPQIIGITVASIGGGTVALGCLIIFACWKRRQYQKARESNLIPFQMDPSTGSSEHKFVGFKGPTERGGPGKLNGLAGRIPPKVPPRLEISNPNMFSRRSVMQETIGLALSPEMKMNQQRQQRQSRLLPEKPNLTLQMPPPRARREPGGVTVSQPATYPSVPSRESTATQFEEDEESADTAVARGDTWRSNSGGPEQIWDYSTGQWIITKPVDSEPQIQVLSHNTAGEQGQLRPPVQASKLTMSPNSYVKPLTPGSKVGSFSQPRRPDAYQRPQQQQYQQQYQQQARRQSQTQRHEQQQVGILTQNGRPLTTSSSIYSKRGSHPGSEVARNSSNHARRSYKQAGPYDHNSIGSLTSFDTEESIISPIDQEPKTAEALSPVLESPASGRSPVSYPKIPGRLSAATIRMVPPPPQPDFTKALNTQIEAGKPWRQAEINAQRARERARAQNQQQEQQRVRHVGGAPGQQRQDFEDNTFDYPAPPAKAAARSQVRSPPDYQKEAPLQNYYLPRLQTQIQNKIPPPPPNPPLTDATGGWGINLANSSLAPKPLSLQPSITFTRSSSTMSQYSTTSKISTSSSLLAKRRGEQKANALILLKNEEEKKRNGKWRVLGKEDIEEAKKADWRPILGSGRGEDKGEYEARTGQQLERTELPNTPGWVPKLTPTRRGDELFLSVQ